MLLVKYAIRTCCQKASNVGKGISSKRYVLFTSMETLIARKHISTKFLATQQNVRRSSHISDSLSYSRKYYSLKQLANCLRIQDTKRHLQHTSTSKNSRFTMVGGARHSHAYTNVRIFFTRNQFIRNLHAEGRNILRTDTTKNEIPKELFDLRDFYNCCNCSS